MPKEKVKAYFEHKEKINQEFNEGYFALQQEGYFKDKGEENG